MTQSILKKEEIPIWKLEENSKVEPKLFLARYKRDDISHLTIKDNSVCLKCTRKPCIIVCPADVYKFEEDRLIVSYDNCVECGSCFIICPYENIEFRYPRWGKGIGYRYG
jgi:ferredoxin like protein